MAETKYRYFMICYYTKPGGQIDEMCSYSKKIKSSDLASQNVILDFGDQKVIKCTVAGKKLDTDWDKLVDYYRRVYPVLIAQLEEANQKSPTVDIKNT